MACAIVDCVNKNNRILIEEVRKASRALTDKWCLLGNKSPLSREEVAELQDLATRVQTAATLACRGLDNQSVSSSHSDMMLRVKQSVIDQSENAQRITQQARMKMGLQTHVANLPYHLTGQASSRDQREKSDIMQILSDWVRVAPMGEQRKQAAARITEFLTAAHASRIDLCDLGLSSLPPIFQLGRDFSVRLKTLNLSRNQLTALPAEIGQLQALHALFVDSNCLTVLPTEMGQLHALRELDLDSNNLTTLPAGIGQLQELQGLFLGHNQLRILPVEISQLRVLRILSVQNNHLMTLPTEICRLPVLEELNLHCNNLTTLPAEIDQLQMLRQLTLNQNRDLQSLPNELLRLRPSCTISLIGVGLSSAVLSRLRGVCNTEGYAGPRIYFSMPTPRTEGSRTIQQLLSELFTIAEMQQKEFSMLMADANNIANLTSWLNRLSDTQDYQRGGQRQKALAEKILSYLELAESNPEFRGCFFRVIEEATETCGDRMALSILHLGVAHKLATADPKDMPKLADLIIHGSWMVHQLGICARVKVPKLRFVDEIEVYLAYPIRLRERLGLQIDVEGMLYFGCSGVTAEDLNEAETFIKGQLVTPDARCNILIQYPEWIKALNSNYPQNYNALQIEKTQRLKLAVSNADFGAIKQWYEKEIVALTKKALKINS